MRKTLESLCKIFAANDQIGRRFMFIKNDPGGGGLTSPDMGLFTCI